MVARNYLRLAIAYLLLTRYGDARVTCLCSINDPRKEEEERREVGNRKVVVIVCLLADFFFFFIRTKRNQFASEFS